MDDPSNPAEPRWSAAPSAKEKNAVQRAVTALLDELAPEKVLKREDRLKVPIEQHRTPNGCVLQAASGAVSVSWFADSGNDAVLGELHVLVWKGTVTRRGSPPPRQGATLVKELVLNPIERPTGEAVWRDTDGVDYDTPALVARCLKLLEEQLGDPPDSPARGT